MISLIEAMMPDDEERLGDHLALAEDHADGEEQLDDDEDEQQRVEHLEDDSLASTSPPSSVSPRRGRDQQGAPPRSRAGPRSRRR